MPCSGTWSAAPRVPHWCAPYRPSAPACSGCGMQPGVDCRYRHRTNKKAGGDNKANVSERLADLRERFALETVCCFLIEGLAHGASKVCVAKDASRSWLEKVPPKRYPGTWHPEKRYPGRYLTEVTRKKVPRTCIWKTRKRLTDQ